MIFFFFFFFCFVGEVHSSFKFVERVMAPLYLESVKNGGTRLFNL
jgi:hypothetical protein